MIQLIENIHTYEGTYPTGYDLVEYEKGTCPIEEGYVLYGFDEIGLMVENNAQHAFVWVGDFYNANRK